MVIQAQTNTPTRAAQATPPPLPAEALMDTRTIPLFPEGAPPAPLPTPKPEAPTPKIFDPEDEPPF